MTTSKDVVTTGFGANLTEAWWRARVAEGEAREGGDPEWFANLAPDVQAVARIVEEFMAWNMPCGVVMAMFDPFQGDFFPAPASVAWRVSEWMRIMRPDLTALISAAAPSEVAK